MNKSAGELKFLEHNYVVRLSLTLLKYSRFKMKKRGQNPKFKLWIKQLLNQAMRLMVELEKASLLCSIIRGGKSKPSDYTGNPRSLQFLAEHAENLIYQINTSINDDSKNG